MMKQVRDTVGVRYRTTGNKETGTVGVTGVRYLGGYSRLTGDVDMQRVYAEGEKRNGVVRFWWIIVF